MIDLSKALRREPFEGGEVMVLRNDAHDCLFYHLCGYALFPQRPVQQQSYNGILTYVPVHGGITYAQMHPEGMIYGFDCNHADDMDKGEWSSVDNVLAESKRMHQGIQLAANYESRYLAADGDSSARALVLDEYHKKCHELGLHFVLTDNFGAMINVLSGQL